MNPSLAQPGPSRPGLSGLKPDAPALFWVGPGSQSEAGLAPDHTGMTPTRRPPGRAGDSVGIVAAGDLSQCQCWMMSPATPQVRRVVLTKDLIAFARIEQDILVDKIPLRVTDIASDRYS